MTWHLLQQYYQEDNVQHQRDRNERQYEEP